MRIDSDSYDCDVCLCLCDYFDEKPIILDGEEVCPECREMCSGNCGEFLTDETIRCGGPIVHFRDFALNGKLSTMHASCAAETMMMYMDREFDYDHTTREQVAEIVARNSVQAVAV